MPDKEIPSDISILKLAFFVTTPSVTLNATTQYPSMVGVPVMAPLAVSNDKPGGRLVAENTSFSLPVYDVLE